MGLAAIRDQLSEIFEPDPNSSAPFVIFELANNHMGSLAHGRRMVQVFSEIAKSFDFRFAFKLQLRDIETFVHPDFQGRMDIPYVKRFSETRLSKSELRAMRDAMAAEGHLAM